MSKYVHPECGSCRSNPKHDCVDRLIGLTFRWCVYRTPYGVVVVAKSPSPRLAQLLEATLRLFFRDDGPVHIATHTPEK